MIADFDNMPMVFYDCNEKYFNNELPTPKFDLMHTTKYLGWFGYRKNKKKNKNKEPLEYKIIKMCDCYDFDEKDFIEIMVHEMIHYYIAWNQIKDNGDHGKMFMEKANEIKEKYGLDITKTKDASSFKKTENAPKTNALWKRIFFNA